MCVADVAHTPERGWRLRRRVGVARGGAAAGRDLGWAARLISAMSSRFMARAAQAVCHAAGHRVSVVTEAGR